jgi:hypothetical protein
VAQLPYRRRPGLAERAWHPLRSRRSWSVLLRLLVVVLMVLVAVAVPGVSAMWVSPLLEPPGRALCLGP